MLQKKLNSLIKNHNYKKPTLYYIVEENEL